MATSGAFSTSNQYIKYTISISEGNYNVSSNTSPVTVSVRFYRTNSYTTYGTGTVYCKINGVTYSASVSPSQKITSSGIVLFSKTLDIVHNTDGSKRLTCSAWISHNAPLSSSEQSYSQNLSVIPRKSSLSVGNGTLGASQTLSVTRQASSFSHTITATCSGERVTVCSKATSTSLSFTPPISWASKNPNGTTVSVTYLLETFSGSSSIGSEQYSKTCAIPSSVAPSVSVSQTDSMGYESIYGGYIQSLSKIQVSINAMGTYGSTIYSYNTSVDGKTYTGSSFTTDVISSAGTLNLSTTVTDSRGRSKTVSGQKTVFSYSPPKITAFTVQRCNVDGTNNSSGKYLKVVFDSRVTSLTNKNTATYRIQYKKLSATSYTTVSLNQYANVFSVTGGTYLFLADTESSYHVILTITDAFGTVTKTGEGGTTKKLFSWLKNGLGFAFGKVAETANLLEVAFDTQLNGDLKLNRNGVRSNISSESEAGLHYNTSAPYHIFNKPLKIENRELIQTGTWTPTLASDGTYPSYSIYYRYAKYYRISDIVYITFHMKVNISNKGSGYVRIKGLPYTASGGCNHQALAIREFSGGVDYAGYQEGAIAMVKDNSSDIGVQTASGMVARQWAVGDTWIGFSGFYMKK